MLSSIESINVSPCSKDDSPLTTDGPAMLLIISRTGFFYLFEIRTSLETGRDCLLNTLVCAVIGLYLFVLTYFSNI